MDVMRPKFRRENPLFRKSFFASSVIRSDISSLIGSYWFRQPPAIGPAESGWAAPPEVRPLSLEQESHPELDHPREIRLRGDLAEVAVADSGLRSAEQRGVHHVQCFGAE